jgi:hypothetical protein
VPWSITVGGANGAADVLATVPSAIVEANARPEALTAAWPLSIGRHAAHVTCFADASHNAFVLTGSAVPHTEHVPAYLNGITFTPR